MVTTVSLGVGFLILSLSLFGVYSVLGVLMSLTIFLALFSNFLFVPSLMLLGVSNECEARTKYVASKDKIVVE